MGKEKAPSVPKQAQQKNSAEHVLPKKVFRDKSSKRTASKANLSEGKRPFSRQKTGFVSSKPGGELQAGDLNQFHLDLADLRKKYDSLKTNFDEELGSTQELNPVERLLILTTSVERVRRNQVKQTERLFSHIQMHKLEDSYALILAAEKDSVRKLFRSMNWQVFQSIAARLDAARTSTWTMTGDHDPQEGDKVLSSLREIEVSNVRPCCITTSSRIHFPNRFCPSGTSLLERLWVRKWHPLRAHLSRRSLVHR
jgi:hypothetical protein